MKLGLLETLGLLICGVGVHMWRSLCRYSTHIRYHISFVKQKGGSDPIVRQKGYFLAKIYFKGSFDPFLIFQ